MSTSPKEIAKAVKNTSVAHAQTAVAQQTGTPEAHETAAATSATAAATVDQKTVSEATSLEELIKKLLAAENHATMQKHQKLKWDNMMTDTGSISFADGKSYPGTFYKTEANQGELALRMENGRTSKPGTLRIGVKKSENSREILLLARLHKTAGHDFYIANFRSTGKPCIKYGVVQTPPDYDQSAPKYLGYPNIPEHPAIVSLNCKSDDKWVEPDVNVLERSHSPVSF